MAPYLKSVTLARSTVEIFIYTSPVLGLFVNVLSCFMIWKDTLFIHNYFEFTFLHIWALSSFGWGFVLMLYQGFVLVFYIEASSSYFMLRLCPHILFWGFGLVFYFEASSSYFILRLRPRIILRLCPRILFWGFGLVFYFEASSSYFILRLCPHTLF